MSNISKVFLSANGISIVWLEVCKRLFNYPVPTSFDMCGGTSVQTNGGLRFTKQQLEQLASLMNNDDTICFASMDNVQIDNNGMFEMFCNVPLRNKYMDIKWPVTKESNKLKVSATGSGWYLYYKNDSGEYEKAKRPDGSDWHVYSRIDGLYWMYKLNGWKQPEGGFK